MIKLIVDVNISRVEGDLPLHISQNMAGHFKYWNPDKPLEPPIFLYSHKSKEFYSGLLPYIVEFIGQYGLIPIIDDRRPKPKLAQDYIEAQIKEINQIIAKAKKS